MRITFELNADMSKEVAEHIRSESGAEYATLKGRTLSLKGFSDVNEALKSSIATMVSLEIKDMVTGLTAGLEGT